MAKTDFLTAVMGGFEAVTSILGGTATTVSSAVSAGVSFLDKNPLVKRIAKSAAGSMYATEDDTNAQRQFPQIKQFDYDNAQVNTAQNIGVMQNPRLQTAVSNIRNRNINLGQGLQKVADMSSPVVRPNKPRMRPAGIERARIKTTVKQPTPTRTA